MTQDFSRKIVIVVREDIASWQLANTVGHIAAYLGNKMSVPFDTEKYFVSKDGANFPRNSQYPIVTLRATEGQLKGLVSKLRESSSSWIIYVQEMVDMIDDEKLASFLGAKAFQDMDILGIGIFGLKGELKNLTGELKLWK